MANNTPVKTGFIFLLLFAVLMALFILDIFSGSVSITAGDIWNTLFASGSETTNTIIFSFRLPKAVTAVLAGMALSVAGLQMQTVFRNPMAGPDVLGITSGASLGVAFVVMGFSGSISPAFISSFGNWMIAAASWAGSGVLMMVILALSARIRDIMTILILGIMLSSGISAIVILMQYFSSESLLKSYVVWTMGSLGNLTGNQLTVLSISVSVGIALSLVSSKMLNALLLGENYAASMGLNVKTARFAVFTCSSILAGSVTAFCGPVGFIGIAVPHVARLLLRTSNHSLLIPATIMTGAAVMLLSDIIAQLPGYGRNLPLNAVTSILGIPIVIWIIVRNRKFSGF
ncbi:MAG: iron ABC transporter permease [Bacteroidales bacterium]|jgi:iron complex transport system permease protein|nr:iron ABC transporter permease [Bacteroidales bacterium]